MLMIELDQPSENVGFILAGPAMKKIRSAKPVDLEFGHLQPITVERYTMGTLEGSGKALMINGVSLKEPERTNAMDEDGSLDDEPSTDTGLPGIPTDRFVGIETLVVVQGKKQRAMLEMPNFPAALKALKICGENFVAHWGLDLEKHRTRLQGPKWTNLRAVARRIQKRYPSAALNAGEQGTVRFRVLVNEAGQVVDCQQSNVTLLERLESPACEEMKHAEFEPALNAEGQPMRSYYATKIRYVMSGR